MYKPKYLFLIFQCLLSFSCKNDFSPYGDRLNEYSLFCIVDNTSSNQFVIAQRLHRENESAKMPEGTKIILSSQNGSINLEEKNIPGYEKYSCYAILGVLSRGIVYRLSLIVDNIVIQWAETSFSDNYINFVGSSRSDLPSKYNNRPYYLYFIVMNKNRMPEITQVKMFIEYEIWGEGKVKILSKEVPVYIKRKNNIPAELEDVYVWELDSSYVENIYSGIVVNGNSQYYIKTADPAQDKNWIIFYPETSLYFTLKTISPGTKPENIRIKRGYIIASGIDKVLYDKYMVKGGQYSVRLDQPIYSTNFRDKSEFRDGIFSAITNDIMTFKIYPEMFSEFGYIDGQSF